MDNRNIGILSGLVKAFPALPVIPVLCNGRNDDNSMGSFGLPSVEKIWVGDKGRIYIKGKISSEVVLSDPACSWDKNEAPSKAIEALDWKECIIVPILGANQSSLFT